MTGSDSSGEIRSATQFEVRPGPRRAFHPSLCGKSWQERPVRSQNRPGWQVPVMLVGVAMVVFAVFALIADGESNG